MHKQMSPTFQVNYISPIFLSLSSFHCILHFDIRQTLAADINHYHLGTDEWKSLDRDLFVDAVLSECMHIIID